MPIDKNEFAKGTAARSLQRQILEFLSKNHDKAYTTVEIVRDMIKPGEQTFGGILSSVAASLDILLEEGKVVGKIVQTGSVRDMYFTVP